MILRGQPGLRRAVAAILVVVGVVAFVSPVRKAVSDVRLVRSELSRTSDAAAMARFTCVRAAVRAAPDVPTYLSTETVGEGGQWFQRGIEFGFGELTYVDDRRAAEQVLSIVDVPAGTGNCGDVQVTVVPPP